MKRLSAVMIAALMMLSGPTYSQTNSCQNIEQLCMDVIKAADEVILEQTKKNGLLEQQLTIEIEERKKISSELLGLKNQHWYLNKTSIFLLGVVTGGLLYVQVSNK